MMWLVLFIAVMCLLVFRSGLQRDVKLEQSSNSQYALPLAPIIVDVDTEEDYLIAVIAAAVQEFTGTADFEVIKIKNSAAVWTLTARQNIVANRQ